MRTHLLVVLTGKLVSHRSSAVSVHAFISSVNVQHCVSQASYISLQLEKLREKRAHDYIAEAGQHVLEQRDVGISLYL